MAEPRKGAFMLITVTHSESSFNYATRQNDFREVVDGQIALPGTVEVALRKLAREYRFSVAEMVSLALSFYFGDGKNHLACEHCDFWQGVCGMPAPGEQTTIPVLDKGMVVVGLSTSDLGE